jgi:hypothetical protein
VEHQSISISLFPELGGPATTEEKQEAVLRGVEQHYAYSSLRPSQMFTIRLPFPTYLEFKKEAQRWQREAEAQNPAMKEFYTMTALVTAAVQTVILPMLKSRGPDIPPQTPSNL